MRESCLVYYYSEIQFLFEVALLYTFYTDWSVKIPLHWLIMGVAGS